MRALIGRAASAASRRICTGQSHSLLSASIISSNTPRLSRQLSTAFPVSNKGIWGQNTEGDNFSVNWSLTEDGVVPTGDAYRNARVPLLTTRLPAKVSCFTTDLEIPDTRQSPTTPSPAIMIIKAEKFEKRCFN